MAISKDFLWDTLASVVAELERVDPQSVLAARVHGLLDAKRMSLHTTDRHAARRRYRDPERDERIAAMYLSGSSTWDIVKELGGDAGGVRAALKRKSVEMRHGGEAGKVPAAKRDESRVDLIRQLHDEGKTLSQIGEHLGITRERVRQICLKNDISTVRCLTSEQKKAVAEYVSGKSLEAVAGIHNVNPSTLRGWILKDGFAIRPAPKTSRRDPETLKRAERAESLWRSGKSLSEISRELGYGSVGAPVYRLLAIRGIDPVKREQAAA